MADDVLAEQLAYYRRRATEYDATAYGDLAEADARTAGVLARLPTGGATLEMACGTGMWTRALAATTADLTAVDAAAEMLEVAHGRCPAGVDFVCADVLSWRAPRRYDLIFFAFWLSHVPAGRLAGFFAKLATELQPGGAVVFVDDHVSVAGTEPDLDRGRGVARRTLTDGSTHRIVKVFRDPATITTQLAALGWRSDVVLDGTDWVVGTTRR